MSEGDFAEIAAYIACGDVQAVSRAVRALCERDGMRLIERRPGKVRQLHESHLRYRAFAVLPGRPGWSIGFGVPKDPAQADYWANKANEPDALPQAPA